MTTSSSLQASSAPPSPLITVTNEIAKLAQDIDVVAGEISKVDGEIDVIVLALERPGLSEKDKDRLHQNKGQLRIEKGQLRIEKGRLLEKGNLLRQEALRLSQSQQSPSATGTEQSSQS